MALPADDVVQLPPGQPGRIAGPEEGAAEPAAAASVSPPPGAGGQRGGQRGGQPEGGVCDEAELRRLALEEAKGVLPNEIRMILSTSEQTMLEVMEMCQDAPGEQLEERLANSLVDLLWAPLAGCVPQLPGLAEADVRMKVALFWRCAAALCAMPLAQLAAMTRRKRPFLRDLDPHVPPASSAPARERLAHVRLNLPIFAMVAKMPSELGKAAEEQPKADTLAGASAAPATTSTEDGVLLEELPRERPAPRAAPADAAADKSKTAARHTYDVGYKKWDKFDVDEALREADDPPSDAPRVQVRFPGEAGADAAPPRTSDDPVEMLEGAMQEQSAGGAAAAAAPASAAPAAALGEAAVRPPADATPMPGPVEAAVEVAAPPTGDGVAWPDDASTTGPVLAADYRKWDAFHDEDDMNSVDGDDGGYREPALGDLDELVGPADEVALIHENWRKESRRRQRAERPQAAEPPVPSRAAEPPLPTGPVIQRPCEYRPLDGPSAAPAQAIAREYDKWQKFDVDAECLNLDNESTTAEGDRTRVSAGPQSAMLQCENYTKDREEYDLDQDIDKQMGGLKKVIAQRVKDAVARKDEGNKLIRAGRSREACVAYARGLEEMHLCEQASVLMSDSVQDKNKRLVSDLQRNLAAAQLEAGEFEGAVEICTGLLKSSGGNDEKALYRRAMALLQLGRAGDAEGDIASLAAKRGDADAAVRRLRSQSAAVN